MDFPWRLISIHNDSKSLNEQFMFSIVKESNEHFVVNLSDFKVLWRERIAWQDILNRAKSENPFMNVDGKKGAIERTISSLADQYKYNCKENELLLKIKYYISGVPFHFYWKLMKSNSDVFFEEITKKLLVTLLNVQDQRFELIDIVKRKDLEINQYKAEGATLTRKNIATQPFCKQEFDRKFELVYDSGLFEAKDGNDNSNTLKTMCNYKNFTKKDDTIVLSNTLNDGPSPMKIKKKSSKEDQALRKFKNKKEGGGIKYQNSSDLMEDDNSLELTHFECGNAVDDEEPRNEEVHASKRKLLKTKLNL